MISHIGIQKHSEFNHQKHPPKDGIDAIIESTSLSTEEKISALENISTQSQSEIQQLKKELDEKDKTIKDILHKL